MAENFTPSSSSGTHPGEVKSSDLQPEFLAIRSKTPCSGCPYFLHEFNCSSFMEVLSRCYWNATSHALDKLFLISSYKPSCQGEKQSWTLPSFLLRETSWQMVPYARTWRICLEDPGGVTKPLRVSRNTSIFFQMLQKLLFLEICTRGVKVAWGSGGCPCFRSNALPPARGLTGTARRASSPRGSPANCTDTRAATAISHFSH